MTREDVTVYRNKEYVTMKEFSVRVNASLTTVKKLCANGRIPHRTFDGRKTSYIEWESGKTIWDMLPHDTGRARAGRKSAEVKYGKPKKEAKEPVVSEPTVSMPSLDNDVVQEVVDLSSFDKEKYADCVLPNGEFDYDKLKLRLTAETYQQKLQRERGELVEKTEIVNWAKKLGTMINSGLESIPQKYTSVLIAKVQSIVAQRLEHPEFEFTEKERTEIRTILKGCGPEIMRSIKLVVMEMEEE